MTRFQAEKMIVEKEDLGLSLSLSFPEDRSISRVQLNLIPSLASSPSASHLNHLHNKKYSWNETFSIADRNQEACRVDPKPLPKGIDVNRSPTTADVEEGGGVSSPNSTISSISGKRSERELGNGYELDVERACSRGISDEEDGETSRKKLRLSKDQSAVLEESFKEHHTLNPKQKLGLAKRLGLTPRQVEVWFQNRRARTKLKQTEVDCEFLKRCCENLTEENRRLQKELQELRALKLSPHLYMQMTPATTLTMCRSCERVATGPPTTSTKAQSAPSVDLRPLQLGPANQRTVPFNLWATSAVPRPMDALQSRS